MPDNSLPPNGCTLLEPQSYYDSRIHYQHEFFNHCFNKDFNIDQNPSVRPNCVVLMSVMTDPYYHNESGITKIFALKII